MKSDRVGPEDVARAGETWRGPWKPDSSQGNLVRPDGWGRAIAGRGRPDFAARAAATRALEEMWNPLTHRHPHGPKGP